MPVRSDQLGLSEIHFSHVFYKNRIKLNPEAVYFPNQIQNLIRAGSLRRKLVRTYQISSKSVPNTYKS